MSMGKYIPCKMLLVITLVAATFPVKFKKEKDLILIRIFNDEF
jgi:hypothetical protein